MRLGSLTFSRRKTFARQTIPKGILQAQLKNVSNQLLDNFEILSAWIPERGNWSTTNNVLTTSTSATEYPILLSYELRSSNIVSTMSLTSAGPGIVFWYSDINNWWAASTFYAQGSETYTSGSYECNCSGAGRCWGCYQSPGFPCPGAPTTNCSPCRCLEVQNCSTCYNTSGRTRYNFFVKIIRNLNGTVSDMINLNLRSLCSISTQWSPCTVGSNDNINGIQISTSENNIIVRGRQDNNTFYGSQINYAAPSPIRGQRSGIVFTPGSNYLLDSSIQNISIVGE